MVGRICLTLMMIVVITSIVVRFTPKAASKNAGLKNMVALVGKSEKNRNLEGKTKIPQKCLIFSTPPIDQIWSKYSKNIGILEKT